jgi:hypothetical protein
MEETLNTKETTQLGIGAVSNSADFWKDAQEFLKSQASDDFQDKMIEYAKSKNYNQNEFRLFTSMLEDAVGFHGVMVILKHYH